MIIGQFINIKMTARSRFLPHLFYNPLFTSVPAPHPHSRCTIMSTELNHHVCRPVRTEEQSKTNYKALEMQRTQSPSKQFTSVFNNSPVTNHSTYRTPDSGVCTRQARERCSVGVKLKITWNAEPIFLNHVFADHLLSWHLISKSFSYLPIALKVLSKKQILTPCISSRQWVYDCSEKALNAPIICWILVKYY